MISNYSLFKYQGIINLNISLNFVFINSERRIVLNTKIHFRKYYICKPSLIFDTFNTFHNSIL